MNKREGNVRPIHYLGSKLRMLDSVKQAVDSVDTTQGIICDLFSGSGTVSKYFAEYRDVISSDIQQYSLVLCEASMKRLTVDDDVEKIVTRIKQSETSIRIKDAFCELVNYENECIAKAKKGYIDSLYDIIENGSIYIYMHDESLSSGDLKRVLGSVTDLLYKNNCHESLDNMITRYYGGLYFSYAQALDMDCIEHEIFKQDGLLKTKMLAALLSTASEIVNTIGKQFAQPLKVRNSKGEYKSNLCKKIIEDRELSVYSIYKKWLTYYFNSGDDNHSSFFICGDYKDTLDKLQSTDVAVVYADPPYTRYHYSRYYHVLETICLRDNPEVSTTFPNGTGGISRAVYRKGRHQSPFCIKSQAEQAFDDLFSGVKELNVPLVLSYSPFEVSKAVTPRLQTMEQLITKAKEYFSCVETISPGKFIHSKLNTIDKNFDSNQEAEILIVCKN